jgi:hypothetical protein
MRGTGKLTADTTDVVLYGESAAGAAVYSHLDRLAAALPYAATRGIADLLVV